MSTDPYRSFKFEVEIAGFVRAGFSKVDGLGEETDALEYREGGDNESPRKVPGQTTFNDVTLERGMSVDTDFNVWRTQVYATEHHNGAQGGDDFRRTVYVYLKNKAGVRVKQWTLYRAWPKSKAVSTLDANTKEFLYETLVLAVEGIVERDLLSG
jgi:phage tail-like protein